MRKRKGDEGQEEERTSHKSEEAEQEERTDSWMTTYSDMVTLLLTFFVLMFAISNVDQAKFALIAAGLSRGGMSEEQFGTILDMYGSFGIDQNIEDDPTEEDELTSAELEHLYNRIIEYIEAQGLGDSITLVYNGEYILLTLANDIWFASGSADITGHMVDNATMLAVLLAETQNDDRPFEVVVAGHTDNVPITSARYPSNWELSVARAVNFLRILISESHLDPTFFSVRGCGEERPLSDNDTAEGRQMNRRVEVLISTLRKGGDPIQQLLP